jgi:hypothetical protein
MNRYFIHVLTRRIRAAMNFRKSRPASYLQAAAKIFFDRELDKLATMRWKITSYAQDHFFHSCQKEGCKERVSASNAQMKLANIAAQF